MSLRRDHITRKLSGISLSLFSKNKTLPGEISGGQNDEEENILHTGANPAQYGTFGSLGEGDIPFCNLRICGHLSNHLAHYMFHLITVLPMGLRMSASNAAVISEI